LTITLCSLLFSHFSNTSFDLAVFIKFVFLEINNGPLLSAGRKSSRLDVVFRGVAPSSVACRSQVPYVQAHSTFIHAGESNNLKKTAFVFYSFAKKKERDKLRS